MLNAKIRKYFQTNVIVSDPIQFRKLRNRMKIEIKAFCYRSYAFERSK